MEVIMNKDNLMEDEITDFSLKVRGILEKDGSFLVGRYNDVYLLPGGKVEEGEDFIYESILGTLFKGKIVGVDKVGELDAIRPEITASAYITGFNHFVIDDEDPVKYGFILK